MTEDARFESVEDILQEDSSLDTEELTFDEIAELVEEATMLRWSSKPTTKSRRCC